MTKIPDLTAKIPAKQANKVEKWQPCYFYRVCQTFRVIIEARSGFEPL